MLSPDRLEAIKSLRTTWVERDVTRAKWMDGMMVYPQTKRERIHPIEISTNPDGEFVFVRNLKDPTKPLGRYYASLGDLNKNALNYFATQLASRKLMCRARFLVPIPNGGNKIAEAISDINGVEVLPIFKKVGVGIDKRIILDEDLAADMAQNHQAVDLTFIEDTTTEATTTIEGYKLLQPLINAKKITILGLGTILDREEGSSENLARFDLGFNSVITKSWMFNILLSFFNPKILTKEQYDFVMSD